MPADKILSYTPREYTIMMAANIERQHDEYERMAVEAIMREKAHREKRPKVGDLYKRPNQSVTDRSKFETMKEDARRKNEWLSRLKTTRKEVADGL